MDPLDHELLQPIRQLYRTRYVGQGLYVYECPWCHRTVGNSDTGVTEHYMTVEPELIRHACPPPQRPSADELQGKGYLCDDECRGKQPCRHHIPEDPS